MHGMKKSVKRSLIISASALLVGLACKEDISRPASAAAPAT
jgi:hypothetical protein